MHISVYFMAEELHNEKTKHRNTAVIDVLRATSVIVTALANGARAVATFKTIEEAVNYKRVAGEQILLGGERNANKIEGFFFGNSPLEYEEDRVQNNIIALTTTNGTQAIERARESENLFILSFLNLKAVCERMVREDRDIVLACAGTEGKFSMDDAMCAGKAVSYIAKQIYGITLDDGARIVKNYYEQSDGDLHKLLKGAAHYENLKEKGYEKDLEFCLREDIFDIVPVYNRGLIELQN